MPYATVPKDLATVKTKIAFGLTKRQLICFGGAALLGLPTFFAAKGPLGSNIAILLMIAIMLPLFFVGMYERDGLPAEKIARNILRTKFLWPAVRVYETDNFYAALQRQVDTQRKEGEYVLRDIRKEKAKARKGKRKVEAGGRSERRR